MSRHTETQIIDGLLKADLLNLTGSPRVVDCEYSLGVDQADDPAVFITAYLDEATKDSEWVTARLQPIIDGVRQRFTDAGVDRYVYVRFARPSDRRIAS